MDALPCHTFSTTQYLSKQVKTDDLKNVLNTQMYSPQDGNAHLGRFTVDPKYTDFIGEFPEKRKGCTQFVSCLEL